MFESCVRIGFLLSYVFMLHLFMISHVQYTLIRVVSYTNMPCLAS